MTTARNFRQSMVLRGIAAALAIGSWMLLPALPVFNGAAAKEGVTISTRDGGVRIDFVDLLTTTALVVGLTSPSVVTTDTRLVTVTNTGPNEFLLFFEKGGGGTGVPISVGATRVLSVPTDLFSDSIRIQHPPRGVGDMSGTLTIQ